MATNVEIIHNSPKVAIDSDFERVQHLEKLREVAQITKTHYFPIETLKKLDAMGVAWIVDEHFASKFPYACGLPINGSGAVGLGSQLISQVVKGNKVFTFGKEFHCEYAGDIPDNILDNIRRLQGMEFRNFTIHSAEKLPIAWKEVNTLLSVREIPNPDPILIAWWDTPAICVDRLGKFIKMTQGYGVLVGIWGGELS